MNLLYLKYASYYGKILLLVSVAAILIALVLFFKTENLTISSLNILIENPLFKYTKNLSSKEYLIYYFATVFFINATLFIIYTFVYYKFKLLQENELKVKMEHYTSLIVDNMYKGCVKTIVGLEDFLGKENFEKLSAELKSSKSKKIFIDVLMKVHENVDGDLQRKLNSIFLELELEKIIIHYLLSPNFHDKVFAMRVISTFNITTYNNIMLKYTKSKNEILRTEAYVALIKVDSDPLEFLMLYPYNLSEWDKVLILNTILRNRKNDFQIEDLIFSENTQVSSFAIFIAAKLQRRDLMDIIVKKINHLNPNVRLNVITAIEEMPDMKNFEKLFMVFFNEIDLIKKQIIQAMRKCPDSIRAKEFLEIIETSSENESIKLFASEIKAKINNKIIVK